MALRPEPAVSSPDGDAHEVKGYGALMELCETTRENLLGDKGDTATRSAMT
jgi:hypothetical protein